MTKIAELCMAELLPGLWDPQVLCYHRRCLVGEVGERLWTLQGTCPGSREGGQGLVVVGSQLRLPSTKWATSRLGFCHVSVCWCSAGMSSVFNTFPCSERAGGGTGMAEHHAEPSAGMQ